MKYALFAFLAAFVSFSAAANPLLDKEFAANISVYSYVQEIEGGADVNGTDASGNTPLHVATLWADNKKKLQLLIDAGADVNKAGFLGITPLHLAVTKIQPRYVSLLLENGADVNAVNNKGQTPLMLAARQGQEDVVSEMLTYGADVTITDKTGWTALHHVATYGSVKTITAFEFAGADVNAKTNLGQTPLQFATSMNNHAGAAILVTLGADPYAEKSDGESIIAYQAALRDKKMLQALLDNKFLLETGGGSYTMPLPSNYCRTNSDAKATKYLAYLQDNVFSETIHGLWAPCDQQFTESSWLAIASVENNNIARNQPVLKSLFDPMLNDRPYKEIYEIGKNLTIQDFESAIKVQLASTDPKPVLLWADDYVLLTSAIHEKEGHQKHFYVVAQMVNKETILSYHLRLGEENIDQLAELLHRIEFFGQAVKVMAQSGNN